MAGRMTMTALSLTLTLLASDPAATAGQPSSADRHTLQAAVAAADVTITTGTVRPKWMSDTADKRPSALPVLYAAFGALQMADAYSTRRAMSAGAVEANPFMKDAARSSASMYAVKAATAVTSIYLAERAWKKNRKGAVILMAVVNGVTAAVVARNLRNAR
jgi:hypothetical protein